MSEPELVLAGGRVVDPESGLEATRDVAIDNGVITAVADASLRGRRVVDVSGLVVAPGFIDLHSHGQAIPEQRLQALDGVTTALELEAGRHPVEAAYRTAEKEGRPINYGFSASWAVARMKELGDLPSEVTDALVHLGDPHWQRPASEKERSRVRAALAADLESGAVGIGLLVGYAQETGPEEYLETAALAASAGVPTFTHARDLVEVRPEVAVDGAEEIVRAAGTTGAAMHYCHVNSTSTRHVDRVLTLVAKAKAEGSAVTTEAYPYGCGLTSIGAAFLSPERLRSQGLGPSLLQYLPTGEWIPDEERLRQLRREDPGGFVIIKFLEEEDEGDFSFIERALTAPGGVVASDAVPIVWRRSQPEPAAWPLPPGGVTHPRSAGNFSRFLRLARERSLFPLAEAVARCSLGPARILEESVPAMRKKGRLQVGCDADLVVFDPATVADRATYAAPLTPSTGFAHVLVGGTLVVREGEIVPEALPGRAVRASPS